MNEVLRTLTSVFSSGRRAKLYLKDVASKPLSSILEPGETQNGVRDYAVRSFMDALDLR